MRQHRLDGLARPLSALVMGCDNKTDADDGAALWSAFIAAGGNVFDTAHIYGKGACERALGDWLARERLTGAVTVIVKGAHTPWCDPANLSLQLGESLDRLRLDRADIYLLHRDNPDIQVGEFVDALDAEAAAGRIGLFGASNWTVARFREANAHADRHGRRRFAALSNNLSLARMQRPVWPGSVAASDDATLRFLAETRTAHFAWSSQARGYFHRPGSAAPLAAGTRPEDCFDSPENRERRRRAERLGARRGLAAAQIATAYVLNQPFPSFALIGPRTEAELADSLPGAEVALSAEELAWLDLHRDDDPG
ncbi:MAG: aldo/keto reductase [Alphaproteobacteria bacterium]